MIGADRDLGMNGMRLGGGEGRRMGLGDGGETFGREIFFVGDEIGLGD